MGILEGITAIGQKVADAVTPKPAAAAPAAQPAKPAQQAQQAQAAKPSNPIQQIGQTITKTAGAVTGAVTSAVGGASSIVNNALKPNDGDNKASNPLRVMSFNVDKMEKTNPDQLSQIIKDKKADVVCLQELNQQQAKDLAAKTGMYMSFQGDPTMNGKAILSKYPIKQEEKRGYGASAITNIGEKVANIFGTGGSSMENRGVQKATIDVGGKDVSIFNTHLSNSNTNERQTQMAELSAIMAQTKGPKICSGDFNEAVGDNQTSLLNTIRGNYQDSLQLAGQAKPTCGDKRIDYLFASPSVKVMGGETATGTAGKSDHFPIIADFLV